MGENISGQVERVRKKTKELKSYNLCLGNGCHTCVCRLFQVIKHISAGLYVYELTYTCPSKQRETGKNVILHSALCILNAPFLAVTLCSDISDISVALMCKLN